MATLISVISASSVVSQCRCPQRVAATQAAHVVRCFWSPRSAWGPMGRTLRVLPTQPQREKNDAERPSLAFPRGWGAREREEGERANQRQRTPPGAWRWSIYQVVKEHRRANRRAGSDCPNKSIVHIERVRVNSAPGSWAISCWCSLNPLAHSRGSVLI